jgi:hypothetical protein
VAERGTAWHALVQGSKELRLFATMFAMSAHCDSAAGHVLPACAARCPAGLPVIASRGGEAPSPGEFTINRIEAQGVEQWYNGCVCTALGVRRSAWSELSGDRDGDSIYMYMCLKVSMNYIAVSTL